MVNHWIVDATGADVSLRNPKPSEVSAQAIADSLAKINRFNGHTARPYSVAQHSLLVADLLQREYGITQPAPRLAALLHDAHEAYTGDLSTPAKACVGYQWGEFECPWEQRVLSRFGVLDTAREYHSLIKSCDLKALAAERRDLLPPPGPHNQPWPSLQGVTIPHWLHLNQGHHATYTWEDWRDLFLETFAELFYAVHGDDDPHAAAPTTAQA
jgi:hypothetical protein